MSTAIKDLVKVAKRRTGIKQRVRAFSRVLGECVAEFNAKHSRRILPRDSTEILPSHPRHVSSARARLGALIEVVLCHILNTKLFRAGLEESFAFNCVTEYPDLYLRDKAGKVRLRLEVKALHNESDEGASRFDTPTKHLQLENDILIVIGWKWVSAGSISWPRIIAAKCFPAALIAHERDHGHKLRKGTFGPNGEPFVISSNSGKPIADQGNFGKLMRLVHMDRVKHKGLAREVIDFLSLLNGLYPDSVKARR